MKYERAGFIGLTFSYHFAPALCPKMTDKMKLVQEAFLKRSK